MGEQPKLGDVEHPRMGEDFQQHPLNPSQHAIDPLDGLPKPIPQTSMEFSKAPPLSPETLVCMADERYYVLKLDFWLRSFRDCVRFAPGEVIWIDGSPWGAVAEENLPQTLQGDNPHLGHTQRDMFHAGKFEKLRQLEAWRPACSHYCRILADFAEDPQLRSMERLCTAQKTEGGEFVSLRDTRIYACELRSPPDFVSVERLRKFDAERVAAQETTEEEWDPSGDLGVLGGKP